MQPDSCFIFLLEVHSSLFVLVLPNHKQLSHLLWASFLSNDSDDPDLCLKMSGEEKNQTAVSDTVNTPFLLQIKY